MEPKDSVTVLPDGSAFFTASFPLPKDHWIYLKDDDGFLPPPPTPCLDGVPRREFAALIRAAGEYAVRDATRGGTIADFDPDALCQNLVVGMLGSADDVFDASGRLIAPPQTSIAERPSGPWDGNGKVQP